MFRTFCDRKKAESGQLGRCILQRHTRDITLGKKTIRHGSPENIHSLHQNEDNTFDLISV
jgi:hypothetical protein